MGKKSSSSPKYTSEVDVYVDLQRLMQIWRSNGTQNHFTKRSFLRSIKMEFRSPRICHIIYSNPDLFNVEQESQFMPMELLSEEFLIQMVYDNPALLCSKDERGRPKVVSIPEEQQTLPVLVAFELGKRRFERSSAIQWGRDGVKIPYTDKALEYRQTIRETADRVEAQIGTNNLKHSQAFEDENARVEYIDNLVASIQHESTPVELRPDEHYKRKYDHFDYNADRKMLILVQRLSRFRKDNIFSLFS